MRHARKATKMSDGPFGVGDAGVGSPGANNAPNSHGETPDHTAEYAAAHAANRALKPVPRGWVIVILALAAWAVVVLVGIGLWWMFAGA
jgi:hypothetical protein